MQPQVSDLLRQRERGRIRVRADVRADRVRVRGPSGPAPDPRRGDSVRRRRADDLPAIPGDREGGQGHGLPPGPGATNGIRLATEDGFLDKVAEAGLNTIYLQFDGLREENYIKARGRPLLDIKLKVIERVRERKGKNLQTPTICFVPTMVNSFNDDQAGEILNYAIKNRDVVKGVNFQPVSLTGRIPEEDRRKLRYTLSDLAYDLEEQTGYLTRDDW